MKRVIGKLSPATIVGLLALIVALGNTGWAANGMAFVLGKVNSATARTFLGTKFNGAALQLSNASPGSGATALTLSVAPTRPPMAVSSSVKVTKLNADFLDDLDSTALARVLRIPFTLAGGATSAPIDLPVNMPVRVMGNQIGGDSQLGAVTIVSHAGITLAWVDAESSGGEATRDAISATAGDHIVSLGRSCPGNCAEVELQVSGGGAIRLHNSYGTSRSGVVTLVW